MEFITYSEAIHIIQAKRPRGLFVARDGKTFIGIDNTTGSVTTKDFESFDDCVKWLKGDKR